VSLMMLGHGMQTTLIPLRADVEQISDTAIGIISSMFYVGFLVGGVLGPQLIVRAGHIRAFAALVSLGSAAALLHPLVIDAWVWGFARFITGFCISAMYLIIESWLNDKADNKTRGLVMSTYTIVVFLAVMLGQVAMTWLDVVGFQAFVIASILLSIAAIPVALTKSAQPAPIAVVRLRPFVLYKRSPAAIVACTFAGMSIGALFSLIPLYSTRIGLDPNFIPLSAGALMFGGLLLQYPLGRLSDFIDRRYVLMLGCIAAIAVCIFASLFPTANPLTVIIIVTLLGGLTQPLYAIAAAHAFDYTEQPDMVETAAGVVLAYGLGSIFGPTLASLTMTSLGPQGLFVVVSASLALLTVFLVYRVVQRESMSIEDKSDYDYASSAPVGGIMGPELYEEGEDDYVLVPEEYVGSDQDEDTTSETPFNDEEDDEGTP
ncbi:MAG: MFS transporter, partial [Pseudomonadota bacterium]